MEARQSSFKFHVSSRPWVVCGAVLTLFALVSVPLLTGLLNLQTMNLDNPSLQIWLGALPATNGSGWRSLDMSEQNNQDTHVAARQEDCKTFERTAESVELLDSVKSDPICWWSGDHGGYSGNEIETQQEGNSLANKQISRNRERRRRGGVVIFGRGCSLCVVGQLCAFEISVRPPAKWVAEPRPRQRRIRGRNASHVSSSGRLGVGGLRESLMVRLLGPALAAADVTTDEGDVTRWRVTYRVWDAGNYSVLVQSECDTLDFAPDYLDRVKGGGSHTMAQWVLSVLPSSQPSTQPLAEPATELTTEQSTPLESQLSSTSADYPTDGPDSPCDLSMHGRWLFDAEKKTYTWQLYPCAQPVPPPSEWLASLQSRNISEINFVGDSHVRFLFHHLFFLLTGRARAKTVAFHGNIFLEVAPPNPSLQPLKLNFYWIAGVFKDGPFGCRRGNKDDVTPQDPTFPEISTTADVTVVDAGFWTVAFCDEPENAFGYYFPNFLEWVKSRVLLAQQQRQQQQQQRGGKAGSVAARVKEPAFLYRSIPPKRSNEHCELGTNALISHLNRMATAHLGRYGLPFYNDCVIAAPRPDDTCKRMDVHYSCFSKHRVPGVRHTDGSYMGPVGEAMVWMFMHQLLYMLD